MKYWPFALVISVMIWIWFRSPLPSVERLAFGLGYAVLVFILVYAVLLILSAALRLDLGLVVPRSNYR